MILQETDPSTEVWGRFVNDTCHTVALPGCEPFSSSTTLQLIFHLTTLIQLIDYCLTKTEPNPTIFIWNGWALPPMNSINLNYTRDNISRFGYDRKVSRIPSH